MNSHSKTMIKEARQRWKYIIGDYLMSNLAWFFYNIVRFKLGTVVGFHSLGHYLLSPGVIVGQLGFPLMMMIVYWLSGYYNQVCRKSRLQELLTTVSSSTINTLLIFFLALINDVLGVRGTDYKMVLCLWLLLFGLVYAVRFTITSITSHHIKRRQWTFPTLVIGCGAAAVAFVERLNAMHHSMGYKVVGFVSIPGENDVKQTRLPNYSLDQLGVVCRDQDIREIIVVPTKQDNYQISDAINRLFRLGLPIKISPNRLNLLQSHKRITDVYGETLVDISNSNMGESSKNIKRVMDVALSAVALLILSPLFVLIALVVKLDSPGPVLFTQERIGKHNKPFKIYKFRSMVVNAELNGRPQLSSDNDPRITRVGRIMRKYRIDELPNFWNVLKGDMSLVGPRPERQYYVDQITQRLPAFALLHQLRPGITSLGMVKFGYARNVDEMVDRASYDLLYLENMSLINDIKIMIYTIKIVFTGRGM